MSRRFEDLGRISAAKQTYHPLTYGNAGNGVHGWALDAFQRAEQAFAAGGGKLPRSVDLFHVEGTSSVLTATRRALETWATRVLRSPTCNADYVVLDTDAKSIHRDRPIVLGERGGAVFGFRVHDAVDGRLLQSAARRDFGEKATINDLLRHRAEALAAARSTFDSRESREQAIARVELLRAIEDDAMKTGGWEWLCHGPGLLARVKTRDEIDAQRLEEARTAVRRGQMPKPPPAPEPIADPAAAILPPTPPPEKVKSPEQIEREEADAAHAEIRAGLDKMDRELNEKEAKRLGVSVDEAKRIYDEAMAAGGAA